MRTAIIAGTGVYALGGAPLRPEQIDTRYGPAEVFHIEGDNDMLFQNRHWPGHTTPPHRINFRANLKALQQLGVTRVLATFAVGSLHRGISPGSLVALDDLVDQTHGREATYFDGGKDGVVHIDFTEPFCAGLRQQLVNLAGDRGLEIRPTGTYFCFNGPRFETAAEIRMFTRLGGDVVGMTGAPEAQLARELGMHYAAVALSINWAAGLVGPVQIEHKGLDGTRAALLALFVDTLRLTQLPTCACGLPPLVLHPPTTPASG